jgi:hypothetical protein
MLLGIVFEKMSVSLSVLGALSVISDTLFSIRRWCLLQSRKSWLHVPVRISPRVWVHIGRRVTSFTDETRIVVRKTKWC